MNPFTISASATYMIDIEIFDESCSLPNATNVATVVERKFALLGRSAFTTPMFTFPGIDCNL